MHLRASQFPTLLLTPTPSHGGALLPSLPPPSAIPGLAQLLPQPKVVPRRPKPQPNLPRRTMMSSIHLPTRVRMTKLLLRLLRPRLLKRKARRPRLLQSPNQLLFGKSNHGVKRLTSTPSLPRFLALPWMASAGRPSTKRSQSLMVFSRSSSAQSSKTLRSQLISLKRKSSNLRTKYSLSTSSLSTSSEATRQL